MSAGAASDRVWIVDGEPATHQAVYVVDLRTLNVHCAELIDQDLEALLLDHMVIVFRGVLQRHAVGKSGTAMQYMRVGDTGPTAGSGDLFNVPATRIRSSGARRLHSKPTSRLHDGPSRAGR